MAGQIDDLAAVGTPVHQIPQEHDLVVAGELEAVDQIGQFDVAAMDVAYGDKSSGHSEVNLLASRAHGSKQESRWI
jgi:hypothetical protein